MYPPKLARRLALLLVLTLAGCGSPEINTVKKTTVPEDPTHTYDTALSNRASCAKETWRTFKDDSNRLAVEYQCTLKSGAELLEALRLQKISDTQSEYKVYFDGIDQSIETIKKDTLESKEKALAEAQAKLAQVKAEEIRASQDSHEDPSIVLSLTLRRLNSEDGPLGSARYEVERAQQSLVDYKAHHEQSLASAQQERAYFEQAGKNALAGIDKTYADIVKATQVFQWVVNGKEVFPAWAGIELEKKDGSTVRWNKDWHWAMRGLLQFRGGGEDYVRYVLNVPSNIIPGQANKPASAPDLKKMLSDSFQQADQKGKACYEAKLKAFHEGMEEGTPVSNDMMNEWRGECDLPKEE